MNGAHFLTELVLLVAIAAAGAALFERARLPSIAGFLVVGTCVGPGGIGLVADPDAVRRVAEIGVVFLLFEIGLELPVERLHRMMRSGLAVGAIQVVATLGIVAAVATALGVPPRHALVLGALVAMSSTALAIRTLSSRGELDAPHGQVTVAVLLFQDLCIVPFLLAIPILAAPGPISVWPVAWAVGKAAVALAVFFVVVRFAVPRVLAGAARLRSEVFSLAAVGVVLGASVAAEEMGLTLAVGAFLVGLAASTSPYGLQLFSEVVPLRGVLLGIFFTAIGMLLDVRVALDHLPTVLAFAAAAIGLKALIAAGAVRLLLPGSLGLGVRAGVTLAQTGEFSFVLAGSAAAAGLLDTGLAQSFVAASVLSLLATPFLVQAGPALGAWLTGSNVDGEPTLTVPTEGHVVLVGLGLAGRNLTRVLDALGAEWVAVEANPQNVISGAASHGRVLYGDATRMGVLRALGIERARLVAVAITDPVATRRVVSLVHELAPEVPVLARARYVLDVEPLHAAGARHVVAEELEGAIDLVSKVLLTFEVPSGAVARFAEELREEGYALLQAPAALRLDPWLAELLTRVDTEWIDVPEGFAGPATLAELDFRARCGGSVLAIDRGGATEANPSPGAVLEGGERILVFGGADACHRARELLEKAARGPAPTDR